MKAILTFRLDDAKCVEVCTLHDCAWEEIGEFVSFKTLQGFKLANLDTIDN